MSRKVTIDDESMRGNLKEAVKRYKKNGDRELLIKAIASLMSWSPQNYGVDNDDSVSGFFNSLADGIEDIIKDYEDGL